ncbi:MAG TPA: hypothetical protein VEC19_02215 [Usitatibacter sp.]|nr:hypothetical protein [Usitatibacter sp.]
MKPEDRKQQGGPQPGQQQQQQPQGGEGQQYGEGNYKATRQYNEGLKEHVQHHDIEREARDAAPKNDAEAREMEDAERVAKGKSRGEGGSPDGEPKR